MRLLKDKDPLTREWVLDRMMAVAQDCVRLRKHAPAIRALKLLGREVNLFVEKTQQTVWTGSFDSLTAAQAETLQRGTYP